jgi:Flp pilus assembly protein TadD
MNELAIGIALLVGIVLAQVFVGKYKQQQLVKLWKEAHAAIEDGRLEVAERTLERCVKMAPLWVHGLVALAMVRGRLGKTEAAEADLKRACALHPKEAEPDYALGLLYATLVADREADAITAFHAAFAKNPDLVPALAADPRLERLRRNPDFEKLFAQHPAS